MLTPSSPVPISYSDQTDAQPTAVLNGTNKKTYNRINRSIPSDSVYAPSVPISGSRIHTSSFMHPPPFKRHKLNHANQCFHQKPIAAHDHLIDCIIESCMRHQQNQIVDESLYSNVVSTPNDNASQHYIFADGTPSINTSIPRHPVLPTTLTSNSRPKRDEFVHFQSFAYHTPFTAPTAPVPTMTSPGDVSTNINHRMARIRMHSNCNVHAPAPAPNPANTYVHAPGNHHNRIRRTPLMSPSSAMGSPTTNRNVMKGAVASPYEDNTPSINAPIPRYPVLRTTSAVRVPTNMNHSIMPCTTSPEPFMFFGDQSPLPYDTMCLETNPYF
eukprot:1062826_1